MMSKEKIKIPEFEGNFPVVEDESMMEVYRALNRIAEGMKGEAERLGLYTDEDVVKFCKQIRRELREERRHRESSI